MRLILPSDLNRYCFWSCFLPLPSLSWCWAVMWICMTAVRVESRRYSARLKRISRWAAVRRPGLTLTASTHLTSFEKSQWTINLAVLSLESDHRGLNSYILVEDNLVLYLLYLSECSPAGRPRLTRSLGLIRLVLTVDKWLEKTLGLYF